MFLSKKDHLDPATGPKRILSLDGGGVRGIISLQYLKYVETLIKKRLGGGALLCDYFDLIGGTSTGSIIAAGLACGMTVDALEKLYVEIGGSAFQREGLRRFIPPDLAGKLAPKFGSEPLRLALDKYLGADTTLDSDRIRTGLMIMTKRLDTGGPWPLHNGGRGKYATQDGALRLTQIVRASTAAPTYFAPEEIAIRSRAGAEIRGAFVDGGVTPFNDPALQLLMLAAFQGHGFCWPTGHNRLLIVSIGTGRFARQRSTATIMADPAIFQGVTALQSLMDDCERMNRSTLQWLTRCLTPWFVDSAVGNMELDSQLGPQLATFVRYNVLLDREWLKNELELDFSSQEIERIRAMDDPSIITDLIKLGCAAAGKQFKSDHFPNLFDPIAGAVR